MVGKIFESTAEFSETSNEGIQRIPRQEVKHRNKQTYFKNIASEYPMVSIVGPPPSFSILI